MSYTTSLAQWAGSQCVHSLRQPSRPQLHNAPRKALLQSTYRKAHLRQHVTHATGTEITDEDLQSAGNVDKARDLQVDKEIEDAEQEEEFVEQMERGLEADEGGTVQEDLAALEVDTEQPEPAQFALNFLWLNKNIAVAVDQLFDKVKRSPVTEYFFWPRKDAWEELKDALEARPWIQERDKILLLNKTTEIINFWQDSETKKTVAEAKEAFPDCTFQGSD